jgi:WD40 repeat protein/serine/threonine protein kinase
MSDTNPSAADPLGQIADEFVEAFRQGQRPSVEEFARRYPAHADEIRDMLPALVLMEQAKAPDQTSGEGASPAAGPPLSQLGDYQILREVGRGGMGVVYEARQLSLGRHVAIKVLPSHALLDPRHLGRFRREARSAAKLHHTNIVPVFGVGEQDGLHYYAMQFIKGLGLDKVLDELRRLRQPHEKPAPTPGMAPGRPTNGRRDISAVGVARGLLTGEFLAGGACQPPESPLPPGADAPRSPETSATICLPGQKESSALSESGRPYWQSVARVGVQVADALAYAAGQGVLHRDIKPSNLLLDDTGNVWVTDFGLAKATNDSDNLTNTGDIVGTLRYMAPERFNGQGDVRSDVYSLGLTLYELLALRPAFGESNRNKLVKQVMHDEPARPRKVNPAVPRDLETVVLKAIARDPAHRYQTPADMADDLKRFVDDRPVQARRVSEAERFLRWCRRNPALAAASALTLAMLCAVAILSAIFAVREGRHARELDAALTVSEEQRKKADYLLAESYLDRGISLCEHGDLSVGLLWLARGLAVAPADAADLQNALRANLADWSRQSASLRGVFRYPGQLALQILSPDAGTVFVVNDAGQAELWDAAAGQRIAELDRDQKELLAAFSSDGRSLVTLRKADGAGRVWDTRSGRPIGAPLPSHGPVKVVGLGPGGKQVLTLGIDNKVRVWDGTFSRPALEFQPHSGPVAVAAFSPDGKTILTTCDRDARLWVAATGQPIGPALQHDQAIAATTFSGNGRFLATGSWDRTAQVWSVVTGQPVGARVKHGKAVVIVALSPDGSTAFFGSGHGGQLWDVVAGTPRGSLLGHRNHLVGAAFSGDGQTLLTASADATARLWDVATGKQRGAALPCRYPMNVVFSPQGGNFAVESRYGDEYVGELRFWEINHERPTMVSLAARDNFQAMCFHRDATVVFTGSGRARAGEARLWDLATGKPLGEALAHPAAVNAVAVSPDGSTLLTGCDDGMVRVWDAATSRLLGPIIGHKPEVRGVAFGPDGRSILTCGSDGTARRWDLTTRQSVGPAWQHPDQVLALAPSLDGRYLLTGGADSIARLWSMAGAPDPRPLQHQEWIISVAVSPDGKIALTGGDDTIARCWDTATGQALGLPLAHQAAVCAVTFSPGSDFAATGCEDHTARRWDVATSRAIGPPLAHGDYVIALAFRADGKSLVTGCADRTVRVWELPVPVVGPAEQITLWVQVITGQELDAAGAARLLDADEWHERRGRLQSTPAL